MSLAIADDDERAEVETPAALDHFGDAVDLYNPLLKLKVVRVEV